MPYLNFTILKNKVNGYLFHVYRMIINDYFRPTSCDVERMFSTGRLFKSYLQGRLSPDNHHRKVFLSKNTSLRSKSCTFNVALVKLITLSMRSISFHSPKDIIKCHFALFSTRIGKSRNDPRNSIIVEKLFEKLNSVENRNRKISFRLFETENREMGCHSRIEVDFVEISTTLGRRHTPGVAVNRSNFSSRKDRGRTF